MLTTRSFWLTASTLSLSLLLCACGPMELPPASGEDGARDPQLYVDTAHLWPKHVPVCWENPGAASAQRRAWVRAAIKDTWEEVANVRFVGWGTCDFSCVNVLGSAPPKKCEGIFIHIIQTGGSKVSGGIGTLMNGKTHNMWLNLGYGDDTWCTTAGAYTDIYGVTWSSRMEYCLKSVAVHEFGHALSLAHEHNRSNTPSSCTSAHQGSYGNQTVGAWDLMSVMNYCNPAHKEGYYLSPGDVAGVQKYYGPTASSFIHWSMGNVADAITAVSDDYIMFRPRRLGADPALVPLAGDFDGDGDQDLLWYGPGSKPDQIWWSNDRQRSFNKNWPYPVRVNGYYKPFVGDFDGDGNHDVFWFRPGPGADYIWWGHRKQFFISTATSAGGYATPVVGDFNGDDRDDIFFYGPGSADDTLWWGMNNRTFIKKHWTVNGSSYKPFAGDFNGDGRDDIFWYTPGSASDPIWWGNPYCGFDHTTTQVGGTYRVAVTDLDGDGADDIVWNAANSEHDYIWLGRLSQRTFTTGVTVAIYGDGTPATGDFDGDGLGDIVWHGL